MEQHLRIGDVARHLAPLDVPRAGAFLPWHLLATIPVTVFLLLWAAGFAGCAAIAAAAFGVEQTVVLGLGGLVAAVCLWTGPGGGRVRDPVRQLLRPVTVNAGPWLVAIALVAGVALLLAYLVEGQGPSWTPGTQAPWAGWADGLRSLRLG